jgi:hypothetical protein
MTRVCRKCNKEHRIFYLVNTKQRHLVMNCASQRIYLPYEEGLAIEVRYSRNMQLIEERYREFDKECDGARDRDQVNDAKWRNR